MKRVLNSLISVGVVVVLTFSLFCAFGGQPAAAADTIKIGHVCSITGWAGMLGSPQRDAMLAMVEDANKKGGLLGKKVEAFIEDDQSNPTTAVIAATKLVRDMKVDVLVAATLSDCAMAIAPIADQEQVPYIVTSPVDIPFKKYVFPVGPGDKRMAAHTMELAVTQLGAKKIALLNDTSLYGAQGEKFMTKEMGEHPGVKYIITEKFDPKDTNMIPQLTKIKAANADLLIVYGTGAPGAIVAKNYKQLGMTVPVLGSGGLGMPDVMKLAGNVLEEMKWMVMALRITVAESLPPSDPYRQKVYDPMKKIFQEKYHDAKALNVFHVSPMDAFVMYSLAVKAANSVDKAAVRDALEKVRFEGLLGYTAPGPTDHQEGAKDTSLITILQNGQFVPYLTKGSPK
jgi:branched-chain amino acid transport system substrate-binding protein